MTMTYTFSTIYVKYNVQIGHEESQNSTKLGNIKLFQLNILIRILTAKDNCIINCKNCQIFGIML